MTEQKKRVVVVDDHPLFRDRLSQLINHELDMEVCGESETAEQAIQLIRRLTPDLAIVDITLKGSSGLELIKGIRALSIGIPILVLSMHEESLYAERALRAGAKGYITKHRASHELLLAIRRVLAGAVYVSEKVVSKVLQKMTSSSIPARTVDTLSDRELAVLEHIGHGKSSRAIA